MIDADQRIKSTKNKNTTYKSVHRQFSAETVLEAPKNGFGCLSAFATLGIIVDNLKLLISEAKTPEAGVYVSR